MSDVPSPATVAAMHGVPAGPAPLPDLPPTAYPDGAVDLDANEDLPPHLQVVDHVEDVLDIVGPHSPAYDPPKVTVHIAHADHEVQRRVIRRALAWPGAVTNFPSQEQNGARALVRFPGSRPQLSIAFDAAAVGQRVTRGSSSPRWVLDPELLP